jgi:hypothetical protein
MSEKNSDNRSAAGSTKSNSSSQKKFQKFPSGPLVKIEIEELRGFYFVYGRPDQTQIFRKTIDKVVANYVAQNYKSGKEMYRLINYGVETTYKDPDDPGKDATPAQIRPMDYSSQVLGRTDSNTTMTSSRLSGLSWGSTVLQ